MMLLSQIPSQHTSGPPLVVCYLFLGSVSFSVRQPTSELLIHLVSKLVIYSVPLQPNTVAALNTDCVCVCVCVCMWECVCVLFCGQTTHSSPCRWAAVYVLERGRVSPPPSPFASPYLYTPPPATPPAPRVPVTQPRLCAICISAPASAKALN